MKFFANLIKLKPKNIDVSIFEDIQGYEDLKNSLAMSLSSEYNINILLQGIAGTGKSSFLKAINEKYGKHSLYIACELATKAGLRDILFKNPKIKILLLDEISRLKTTDQEILLNLAQTGELIDTRSKSNKRIKFNDLKIIATSNNIEKLIDPILDRFDSYIIKPYTFEEIEKYATFHLCKMIKDKQLIRDIIDQGYNELGLIQIRQYIIMGKMIKNHNDLRNYISTKLKHS